MVDPGDLRLRRLRASPVLGEHEDESGEQQGARGKARLLFVAAGARGGALPRCQSWAAVAAAAGADGSEHAGMKTAPTSGARASAAGEERGRRLRPGHAAGLGCGAGPRSARLCCGRWAERGGEASWAGAGAGPRGKERGPAGRIQEWERDKNDSFLCYFFYFPKPFLNSTFNSF